MDHQQVLHNFLLENRAAVSPRSMQRRPVPRHFDSEAGKKPPRMLRADVTSSADFSEDGQKLLTNSEMRGAMTVVKSVRRLPTPTPTLPLLCDSAKVRGRRRARKAYPELVEGRAPPALDSGFFDREGAMRRERETKDRSSH
jgi:hypothetical protein